MIIKSFDSKLINHFKRFIPTQVIFQICIFVVNKLMGNQKKSTIVQRQDSVV